MAAWDEVMDLPYPTPSSSTASKKMRANRRTDTKPEIALRSLLHRKGLRFRKDYHVCLPNGKAAYIDLAFTKKKIAVFVDGCFWHCCPDHGSLPKSNRAYWIPKLRQNVERDRATDQGLKAAGWRVMRFWEHVQPEEAADTILKMYPH